jgi:hypothetical protein
LSFSARRGDHRKAIDLVAIIEIDRPLACSATVITVTATNILPNR